MDVNPTPLGVTVTQSASMLPVAAGVVALAVGLSVGPAVGLAVAAIDGAWDTAELLSGHPLP